MKLIDLGWPLLWWLMLAAVGGWVVFGGLALVSDVRADPLPRQRKWPIRWTGLDVWMIFLFLVLVPSTVLEVFKRVGVFAADADPTPGVREREHLWATLAAAPLVATLVLGGLRLARGVWPADVGVTLRRAPQSLVLGFLVWLAVTPVCLAVYFAATLVFPEKPHMVLRADLRTDWLLILAVVVVAAPVLEELVFRGVLLPWSLNARFDGQVMVGVAAAVAAGVMGVSKDADYNPAPLAFVMLMLPGYLLIPYLMRAGPALDLNDEERDLPWALRAWVTLSRQAEEPATRRALAIYGNGLLFGAFHSANWPAPLALFVLGVALAWLTQRTRSLVGPVAAHALFNAVSYCGLVLPPEAIR